MLVSVIIPTYKRQQDLARCLDCLAPGKQINATWVADLAAAEDQDDAILYEVVVSDDGDVAETKAKLGPAYDWAKIVEGPHRGPASNRNNAVAQSSGIWLAFTDDDCVPDSGWINALANAAGEDTPVVEGKTITDEPSIGIFSQAPTNLDGGKLWSCNMLFRKSYFLELGGFDEGFPYPHMEDVDLRETVLETSGPFPFEQEAVILHPQRIQKPGLRLAKQKESNFYYAQKRNMSLYDSGYNSKTLFRIPVRQIFISRFGLETFEYAFRLLGMWIALVPLQASWKRKYKVK